jgi:hypothetical protein
MEENRLLLSELYTAYFNRAPDAAGLAYWLNELDNDVMDFGSIASNWANEQQEFTDTYGEDADSSVLITQVYANVLGRSPDTAGATYWAAELASGNILMDQFVLAIVNGAKASTGSSSDAALLNNKAQVGIAMADAGINDLAFAAQVIATVTADPSTVGIVESVITMAAADTAGLANATATLESVQAILADTNSAATLTTTLANLETVMQNLAEDVAAGTVTNIAATLTAATATVEAATQDASFVANPETLATSIAANPIAVEEDAAAVVEEATTPTTPELTAPSTGGGGGGSAPVAPTFTASADESGTITFGGTATGNITMNDGNIEEGDTQYVTFTRGGVTTDTVTLDADSEVSVASGQTYVNTAAQADGAAIEGAGTVNITGLEDTLDADLSGITTTTVTAAMTGLVGEGSVPQFTGDLGNAALTLTGSADFLNGSPTIGEDASFVINASSYIMLSAVNASGKTITGSGTLSVFALASDTNTAGFASSLTVNNIVTTSANVSAFTNLSLIDGFNVHSGQTLTITAAKADDKTIVGLGSTTITGSDSDDTLSVSTTGTNSITAGLGLDIIELGYDGIGTDTIIINLGANGAASDSAPGYGGVAHTIDNILNFDIATDKLDLAGGTGLLADSTYSYNGHSITVSNGVVTAYNGTDGNVLIGELLHILTDTTNSVAFATTTGYTVLQGDGVADGQISDIVVKLIDTAEITNLATILTAIPAAPTIEINDDTGSVTGVLSNNATTNDVNLLVKVTLPTSGTVAVAGDIVRLYTGTTMLDTNADGVSADTVITATDISNGYVNVTTSTLVNNAAYALNAKIVNQDGRESLASASTTVIIDTTAPVVASSTPITNTDTGTNSTGAYAEGDVITIAFSEAVNTTTLTLSDITLASHSFGTGATLAAVSASGGFATSFAITLGSTPTVAATDIITVASAKAVDATGNTSDTVIYTVPAIAAETVAPTLTITSSVAAVKTAETALITFTFSEVPTGFIESDITVTGGILSEFAVNGGDSKIYTATFTPTTDTQATASIMVEGSTYTDAASNNGGAGSTPTLAIDTLAPTAPAALNLATADDTGTSTSDNITKNTTGLTFDGTGENGSTITLFKDVDNDGVMDDGESLGTATVASGVWTIDNISLAQGTHHINAFQTDAAGNASAITADLDVAVDTTAPTLDISTLRISDGYISASEKASVQFNSNFSITDPSMLVTISIDDTDTNTTAVSGTTTSYSSSSSSPGNIYKTLDVSTLTAGRFTATITAEDAAGNTATDTADVAYDVVALNTSSNSAYVADNNTLVVYGGNLTGVVANSLDWNKAHLVLANGTIYALNADSISSVSASESAISLILTDVAATAFEADANYRGAGLDYFVAEDGFLGANTLANVTSQFTYSDILTNLNTTYTGDANDSLVTVNANTGFAGATSTLLGGAGWDQISFVQSGTFDFSGSTIDKISGFEAIVLTSDSSITFGAYDFMTAGAAPYFIVMNSGSGTSSIDAALLTHAIHENGGTGSDTLIGSIFDDQIVGGDGIDSIRGKSGDDTIGVGANGGFMSGEASTDTIIFEATAADNGSDAISGFTAGATNGDILNFNLFITGGVYNTATAVDGTSTTPIALADIANKVIVLKDQTMSKEFTESNFFGADKAFAVEGTVAYNMVVIFGSDTEWNNSSEIYYVTDGTAADDMSITLVGTLRQVDLTGMTADNFLASE